MAATMQDNLAGQLPKADRILFMRRYWNGEAVKDLAKEYGTTPKEMAKRMYRLLLSLRIFDNDVVITRNQKHSVGYDGKCDNY